MTSPTPSPVPLVLIAGGSSAAGIAVATALVAAGLRVLTVGSDAGRIHAAADLSGAVPVICDLADPHAVAALAEYVHRDFGAVDGLIHLVGGWRGGKGLAAQSDVDWDFLHTSVLTTLRNTSRAFYDDIAASPAGRLAIVSSTAVTSPTPGNANYVAVKAAAEAWVQALASGLGANYQTQGAAVVLVIKALVDDAMRAASPERTFPGFTDVADLGHTVVGLFSTPATALNGSRIVLS
jgi:3-oxoacyl-[acyl-carrier protein] reductase